MAEQQTKTVPSDLATLLIPVSGNQFLLLPGITVAEVIHYEEPVPQDGKPDWFLGTLDWRTQQIPLVAYEGLNQQPCERSPKIHIAVLNGSEDPDALPFYAILTQATPRLLRLASEEISEDRDARSGPMDAIAARVSGEPVVIPDVQKIERAILKAMKK